MGKKMTLSIVVLEGNVLDKKLYEQCLASISFADQIVKINTKSIKGSFSEWRNEGLINSSSEWILYIDSDEIVTNDLRSEIETLINNSTYYAYAIPRRNFIFGHEFKHGGQFPDYQKRLFLRKNLKKWKGNLHEEPQFEGKLGYLKNPILHYKNMTISQMIDKTNIWSEIEAQLLFDAGHPKMNTLRFLSVGFREFFFRMIKQLSFLDGSKGVIYAMYQVYSRLITYSKLWEKQL